MADPTNDVWQDPDFQKLAPGAKQKVLLQSDPEFAKLSPAAQAKVVGLQTPDVALTIPRQPTFMEAHPEVREPILRAGERLGLTGNTAGQVVAAPFKSAFQTMYKPPQGIGETVAAASGGPLAPATLQAYRMGKGLFQSGSQDIGDIGGGVKTMAQGVGSGNEEQTRAGATQLASGAAGLGTTLATLRGGAKTGEMTPIAEGGIVRAASEALPAFKRANAVIEAVESKHGEVPVSLEKSAPLAQSLVDRMSLTNLRAAPKILKTYVARATGGDSFLSTLQDSISKSMIGKPYKAIANVPEYATQVSAVIDDMKAKGEIAPEDLVQQPRSMTLAEARKFKTDLSTAAHVEGVPKQFSGPMKNIARTLSDEIDAGLKATGDTNAFKAYKKALVESSHAYTLMKNSGVVGGLTGIAAGTAAEALRPIMPIPLVGPYIGWHIGRALGPKVANAVLNRNVAVPPSPP